MAKYRIIEHPKGVFRVEKKTFLGWETLIFHGSPVIYTTPVPMAPLTHDVKFRFESEQEARNALALARSNKSVTNITYIED